MHFLGAPGWLLLERIYWIWWIYNLMNHPFLIVQSYFMPAYWMQSCYHRSWGPGKLGGKEKTLLNSLVTAWFPMRLLRSVPTFFFLLVYIWGTCHRCVRSRMGFWIWQILALLQFTSVQFQSLPLFGLSSFGRNWLVIGLCCSSGSVWFSNLCVSSSTLKTSGETATKADLLCN